MKLLFNMIYFFLICIPAATILLMVVETIYFLKYLKNLTHKEEKIYEKPVMKIFSTVVPKSFLEKFVWDEKLFENKIIINDD